MTNINNDQIQTSSISEQLCDSQFLASVKGQYVSPKLVKIGLAADETANSTGFGPDGGIFGLS